MRGRTAGQVFLADRGLSRGHQCHSSGRSSFLLTSGFPQAQERAGHRGNLVDDRRDPPGIPPGNGVALPGRRDAAETARDCRVVKVKPELAGVTACSLIIRRVRSMMG
jgi:hypothetical protein